MRISTPVNIIVDAAGSMLINFKTWTQQVSDISIIEGTGSPEDVQSAKRSRFYMDTAGSPGSRLYIKTIDQDVTGDDKVGWELV